MNNKDDQTKSPVWTTKDGYLVNEIEGTVSKTVISKGCEYKATAKCSPKDTFNVEVGSNIVKYRLEIQQRKHDLMLVDNFLYYVKKEYDELMNAYGRFGTSKQYMIAIQNATTERTAQLKNINFCKKCLEYLGSGDAEKIQKVIDKSVVKEF